MIAEQEQQQQPQQQSPPPGEDAGHNENKGSSSSGDESCSDSSSSSSSSAAAAVSDSTGIVSEKVSPADSEKITSKNMPETGIENSCKLIPTLNRYVIPSIDISIGHITKVVAMDHHSKSLMTSDSAGYVSIYNIDESLDIDECDEINNHNNSNDKVSSALDNLNNSRELFYQAYKVEFDSLKSVEIEAKINCLCNTGIYTQNSYSYLLANDKSIRLFRASNKSHIYNRQIYKEKLVRKFDCHQFNINSVSASTNQLNFLSADDLNIHLWDYERAKIAYGIVDIRPPKMDELVEVISSAKYDPYNTNIFAYSSSKGTIHLCDERLHSNFVTGLVLSDKKRTSADKRLLGPFYELFMSISDFDLSPDLNHICSRDYTSVKIWDKRQPDRVLLDKSIISLSKINPILVELYDKDYIFDRFELKFFDHGKQIVTGFYDNSFAVLNINDDDDASSVEARNSEQIEPFGSNLDIKFYRVNNGDNSGYIERIQELNISLGNCLSEKCCFLDVDSYQNLYISTSKNVTSVNLDSLLPQSAESLDTCRDGSTDIEFQPAYINNSQRNPLLTTSSSNYFANKDESLLSLNSSIKNHTLSNPELSSDIVDGSEENSQASMIQDIEEGTGQSNHTDLLSASYRYDNNNNNENLVNNKPDHKSAQEKVKMKAAQVVIVPK